MRKIVLTAGHPRRQCVDLRTTFGKGYKYTYDESYHVERPDVRAQERAWLTIMPCLHGHIYPWGGTTLAVSVDTRGTLAKRIAELSCTELRQDGTDGLMATFDAADFKEVAQLIKPRRRRQLSKQQKQIQVERLRQFRYQPAAQAPETALESLPTASGV